MSRQWSLYYMSYVKAVSLTPCARLMLYELQGGSYPYESTLIEPMCPKLCPEARRRHLSTQVILVIRLS